MTTREILCSCHASFTRIAARELARIERASTMYEKHRITAVAKDLVGPEMMVVVMKDPGGTVSWQLLPRL